MPVPNAIGFENAPTEILIGGSVFLAATIAFIASQATSMGKAQTSAPLASPSVEEVDVIPRENAVLVFGASGRSGRQIVSKLLASGRTVVAAVRDQIKALEIFGEAGVTEGQCSDPANLGSWVTLGNAFLHFTLRTQGPRRRLAVVCFCRQADAGRRRSPAA